MLALRTATRYTGNAESVFRATADERLKSWHHGGTGRACAVRPRYFLDLARIDDDATDKEFLYYITEINHILTTNFVFVKISIYYVIVILQIPYR